jgi:hypothetical protein
VGRALDRSRFWISVTGLLMAMGFFAFAAQAKAASYPAGGSSFSGSVEGWAVKSATCTVPLGLCSAGGGYDAAVGDPAGSFANTAQITLNIGGLFNASVASESPDFTVGSGGAGTLSLQRQFVPGGLITLTPAVSYTASVVDKTSGTETQAVTESISAESGFTGKGGAVTLVKGHTYAIKINSVVNSTLASIGLLGQSTLRFDNVRLTDSAGNGGEGGGDGNNGGNGGDGGNGGNGAGGLSDSRLATLMQGSLTGPAVIKGKRIFVKAKCPASVGRACRVSVQGLMKKGKPATSTRTAKIPQGKAKQLVLKIKPALKSTVSKKKNLLFKQTVKAGSAKATVYKRLKLVKRS